MSTPPFQGLTLDAGALIGIERQSPAMREHLSLADRHNMDCVIPAGVLAQVWRASSRGVHLDRALKLPNVTVRSLTDADAKLAGELCGHVGTRDVIDASVVVCALRLHHAIITSDPDDIHKLSPAVTIFPA